MSKIKMSGSYFSTDSKALSPSSAMSTMSKTFLLSKKSFKINLNSLLSSAMTTETFFCILIPPIFYSITF